VEVATTLLNMGGAYQEQGGYDKKIVTYNRALVSFEEKLGPDHVRTATTRMRIATVLVTQEKYDEAMEKYNKVMPIYEKEYSRDSVQKAGLLTKMGVTLYNQGKYEDAMVNLQLTLAIRETLLGHQHTVHTRDLIARMQEAMQTKESSNSNTPYSNLLRYVIIIFI
jgi:tetratricopeptide (TPR) repeat protein